MLRNAHTQQNASSIDDYLADLFHALSLPIRKMNHILVMGPGATLLRPQLREIEQTHSYWHVLFEAMITWCIEHSVIEEKGVENEMRQLLSKGAWRSLGYQIEEYLINRVELQSCLKDVLRHHARSANLQFQLVRLPFRGFISTAYDLSIETAYEQVHHRKLTKFYASSGQQILEACQQDQPFMLKLYGDIEHADSLILGRRWLKGLINLYRHTLLRPLLSTSPVIFFGFEKNDPDYKQLKFIMDEHPPSGHASITIPEVVEDQHQDPNASDAGKNMLSSSSSPTLSNVVIVPASGKYILSQNYNNYLYDPRSYNSAISAQTVLDKLDGKPPIEIYTVYTETDHRYFSEIDKNVFKVLKSLSYNISCHESEVERSRAWQYKSHLQTAKLIFPLISLSFIRSDFWKCDQMMAAINRHRSGDTRIIPVLVHPADAWTETSLGVLEALPTNGKPISKWSNKQEVYNEIEKSIRAILKDLAYGP